MHMLWKCNVSASNHCEVDQQRQLTQHLLNAIIRLARHGLPWINGTGVCSNSFESSTNTNRKLALAWQLVFDVPFRRCCTSTSTQFASQPACCDRRLGAPASHYDENKHHVSTTASYAPRFRKICDVVLTCTGGGGGQWVSERDGQFENRIAKFHP